MATRITQSQLFNDMRVLMGLNADGGRNGNGLLDDVKTVKEDIESINRNLISIDHKLERQTQDKNEMADDIKEIKENLAVSLEKINKNLADKISVNSISKAQKTIIATSATLGAIGGIISIIINFASKLGS